MHFSIPARPNLVKIILFFLVAIFAQAIYNPKPAQAMLYLGLNQCYEDANGPCAQLSISTCQNDAGIYPDNVCLQNPWTFKYARSCYVCAYGNPGECTYDYVYSYNTCSTADRCEGSNTGGTGYASNGHVLPGICSASSYDGNPNNPQSACISGGWYKQCCSSGGYDPATACSNGTCPSGQITSAGVTSCQSPAVSTCDGSTYAQSCNGGTGVQTCQGRNGTWDPSCNPNCSACQTRYYCNGNSCTADSGGGYATSDCAGACAPAPTPAPTAVPAYCGDGKCNNGETCSSCSGDCGACTAVTCNTTPYPTLTYNPANTAKAGQNLEFLVQTADASTFMNNYWTGGVTNCHQTTGWDRQVCTATRSGTYQYTHTWKHCVGSFSNCSPTCSLTINYTIANAPPTATITGPATGNTGQALSFSATASDPDDNLNHVELWISPTSGPSWTRFKDCTGFGSVHSYTCTGTIPTTLAAGTYYVTMNAADTNGAACTGNPLSDHPAGWPYCGSGGNDRVTLTLTVPNSPPTGSITGPTSGNPGDALSYTATASDVNSNLNQIGLYISPTTVENWTFLGNCTFAATGSANCTKTIPTDRPAGTYYLTLNAYDPLAACTGNPFLKPAGWTDCGANDYLTLSLATAAPPAPTGLTATCLGSVASFLWDPSTTATGYDLTVNGIIVNAPLRIPPTSTGIRPNNAYPYSGMTAGSVGNTWGVAACNTGGCNTTSGTSFNCPNPLLPWIQTSGDVHSNSGINAPGGP